MVSIGGKQFALVETQREEGTEIADRLGADFAFPLRDQITMVTSWDRIAKLDGKTIPDALGIGHAPVGFLPDLGAFTAILFDIRAKWLDAQLQGARAGLLDFRLELNRPSALFEILRGSKVRHLPQSRCHRNYR